VDLLCTGRLTQTALAQKNIPVAFSRYKQSEILIRDSAVNISFKKLHYKFLLQAPSTYKHINWFKDIAARAKSIDSIIYRKQQEAMLKSLAVNEESENEIFKLKNLQIIQHKKQKFYTGIIVALIVTSLGALVWYRVRKFYNREFEGQKSYFEKQGAVEEERTRMAQELHDGLGSMLSGIKHSFSAIKNEMHLDNQQEINFSNTINKLNQAIGEIRSISHSMAPGNLLHSGIEDALMDYCNNSSQPAGLKIKFEGINLQNLQLKEEQAFHILRIVQELIQNITKHAHAKNAIVQLSLNNNLLYLTIEDDGIGFDLHKTKLKAGIGLNNIKSRLKIINGKMDIKSALAKGTSVFIEITCTSVMPNNT
jgi:signal transduction histidine kinase